MNTLHSMFTAGANSPPPSDCRYHKTEFSANQQLINMYWTQYKAEFTIPLGVIYTLVEFFLVSKVILGQNLTLRLCSSPCRTEPGSRSRCRPWPGSLHCWPGRPAGRSEPRFALLSSSPSPHRWGRREQVKAARMPRVQVHKEVTQMQQVIYSVCS